MRPILLLLLLSGLAPVILPAQTTLYWDTNGSTIGRALGDGTWSTSATNWTTATTGDIATVNWTDGSIADIYYGSSGVSSTLTLGSDISAIGIIAEYNPSAVTIEGNGHTLTLTGAAQISANVLPGLVINAPIAGSAGLMKTGDYDLSLMGTNTYTGLTTASGYGGIIVYNSSSLGAAGAGNETVASGNANIHFMNGMTMAEGFVLNGGGGLYVDTAATSDVTLTGPVTLSGYGILQGNSTSGTVLHLTGNISETGGPWGLRADRGVELAGLNTFTGIVNAGSENGGLLIADFNNNGTAGALGAGTGLQLGYVNEGYYDGRVTYTGTTATSNRSIQLVGNHATIDVSNVNTTLTLTGLISDAVTSATHDLEKAGPGALVLRGDNTFTGETYLTNGTLVAGHNNALGSNYVEVGFDGTNYNNALSLLLENNVTLGLDVDVGNFNNDGGTTTLGMSGAGTATFAGEVYITRTVNVNADTGATLNFTNYFSDGSGGGSIIKTGAGRAVFSGDMDLRGGGIDVTQGEVQLTGSVMLANSVHVRSGATLTGDATLVNASTGSTAVVVSTGGTLNPGLQVGTLTTPSLYLSAGSQVTWQLGALTTALTGQFDRIIVNSGPTDYMEVYSSSALTVDLSLLAISSRPLNADPAQNDPFWQSVRTWNIIAFTGTGSNSLIPGTANPMSVANAAWAGGTFDTFVGGGSGEFTEFTVGNVFLRFTPSAVPEPSTYALLLLGGAGLLGARMRRRA